MSSAYRAIPHGRWRFGAASTATNVSRDHTQVGYEARHRLPREVRLGDSLTREHNRRVGVLGPPQSDPHPTAVHHDIDVLWPDHMLLPNRSGAVKAAALTARRTSAGVQDSRCIMSRNQGFPNPVP
jgi:hypothetical protein